ncbi:YolD-like family protein [Brevibacillus agri]|uniref:YolD-like family protein n=1 Tax=Brevibacillus agri TaxID=51101 RepID=UPI0025B71294|nr:YolD-like family protein [Brevibacillus agri]MDN4094364.1 YolD-like family protein [Brevibacillus agri]
MGKRDNLFASMRIILPQQRDIILELQEEKKLVPQPVVEQDELEQFDYAIRDSARNDYAITVNWWKEKKPNLGTLCSFCGVVKYVDTKKIKIVNVTEVVWIESRFITSVIAD